MHATIIIISYYRYSIVTYLLSHTDLSAIPVYAWGVNHWQRKLLKFIGAILLIKLKCFLLQKLYFFGEALRVAMHGPPILLPSYIPAT